MPKFDDDLDALFKLPLADFISGRKALEARLKKDGRAAEADRVKSLTKPSMSAWAVNQLYLQHREAFDELIASGQRFRKAQTSRQADNMRDALDARREAVTELSDLATEILRDAGHNPTLDSTRRITSTLEAVSAYVELPDDARPGRLTEDVDPPGFESFGSFTPGAGPVKRIPPSPRIEPPKKTGGSKLTKKATSPAEGNRLKELHQARIAAAKTSLQDAKKSLADARVRARSLETTHKKVDAAVKEAEKEREEAEARLIKARATWEDARRRARSIAAELEQAARAVERAQHTVEKATKELETVFGESQ